MLSLKTNLPNLAASSLNIRFETTDSVVMPFVVAPDEYTSGNKSGSISGGVITMGAQDSRKECGGR